jgi:hypothetical protein
MARQRSGVPGLGTGLGNARFTNRARQLASPPGPADKSADQAGPGRDAGRAEHA